MSSIITKSYYEERTSTTTLMIAHIQCDTSADLPARGAFQGITLLMSSVADVIDTGNKYKMNSNGVWILQPVAQADAYTRSQTDALISGRIPFDLPQIAAAGDDLDTYIQPGTWFLPSAAGVLNNPASGDARLDVIRISDTIVRQIVRPVGSNMRGYIRNSYNTTPATWAEWFVDATDNTIRSQIYMIGRDLTTGDDLNSFNASDYCGSWQASTRAIAQTILHRPAYSDDANKLFRMEQYTEQSNSRFFQELFVFGVSGTSNGSVERFIRSYTAAGWSTWYQYALSTVTAWTP